MSDRVWKWVYPLPYVIGHSNQLSQNKFFDLRTPSMRKFLDRGETEGGRGKLNYCFYFDKKNCEKIMFPDAVRLFSSSSFNLLYFSSRSLNFSWPILSCFLDVVI